MSVWRNRARARAGMTLVEMLIVVAIIAVMASVAIPTFARLGFLSRGELQNTSHELFALLRASRIYAATYRVNTGIAYDVTIRNSMQTINSVAMVYELPGTDLYAPVVDGRNGPMFRQFPTYIGILAHGILDSDTDVPDIECEFPRQSLKAIQIVDEYTVERDVFGNIVAYTRLAPHHEFLPSPANEVPDEFPAHIFEPSGRMASDPAGAAERNTIALGFTPDADPRERFVNELDASDGKRTIPIDLYRSTGRVKFQ